MFSLSCLRIFVVPRCFIRSFRLSYFIPSVSYDQISLLCSFSCRFALLLFFFLGVGCVSSVVVVRDCL